MTISPAAIRGVLPYGDTWSRVVAVRSIIFRILVILGQSNGNGTTADSTYGGLALATAHPGFSPVFWHAGVPVVVYDSAVGGVPYLFELMATETSDPVIIRRSVNGQGEVNVREVQIPGALADLSALGAVAIGRGRRADRPRRGGLGECRARRCLPRPAARADRAAGRARLPPTH